MPLPLKIVAIVVLALDVLVLALPALLRRRGVSLWWHTMFGPALVFDSTDDEGHALRLLNVRGKYQSVAYVQEPLRWELACLYHQYFAQVVDIAGLAGEDEAATGPEGAGPGGAGPGGAGPSDAGPGGAGPGGNATVPNGNATGPDGNATGPGGNAAGPNGAEDPTPTAVVIGGGGYSFPKWLVAHCPRLRTTVVEIDPQITRIAREHFFLDGLVREFRTQETGALELVADDGWAWLGSCGRRFDLVVNDAFSGKRPLGPLGTAEGARLIHEHLTPRGLYLANVIAPLEGRGSEHLAGVAAAFQAEFAHVWLIPEDEEDPQVTADNVLVASDRALPIARRYAR